MARETILAETTFDTYYLSNYGMYGYATSNITLNLSLGDACRVVWDGEEHTCTVEDMSSVLDGVLGLGNLSFVGMSSNNEPFAIGFFADGGVTILSTTDTKVTSHTVTIYQGEEYGLVIQDRNGEDITYKGVDILNVPTTDGNMQTFSKGEAMEKTVELDFSNGDMVVTPDADKLFDSVTIPKPSTLIAENIREDVEVAGVKGELALDVKEELPVTLDFSSGNMEITADEGKAFSKVSIPQPETLIPENIAEGINVAGILGTLAAGGSNVVIASGKFRGNNSRVTITHNLGVIPDLVVVTATALTTSKNNSGIKTAIGATMASKSVLGLPCYQYAEGMTKYSTTAYYAVDLFNSTSSDITSTGGYICQATEESIIVGGTSSFIMASGVQYYWFAIGGLT